ncbi:NUDIX domain-containing protein, partial [Candidatus Woesebacteria bacterium]|nr:NUDIX domain-containing protein [Candidatus Woesebacteria bacterium]
MKHTFSNANLEPVPYDGSEVTWRVSAYALIIRDGKLLLAKSKHEKFYDVIGGGVDIGETIEEALHREAAE